MKWAWLGLSWLFLLAARPAHAQVPITGKGFLLEGAGSITSAPGEVISGRYSIKGAYSGANSNTAYLYTDPQIIPLAPNQTYRLTASYRILTASAQGFEIGFFSPSNNLAGRTTTVTGGAGSSGTASVTFTLQSFSDYLAGFKIDGTGAIAIDDIQITDGAGRLVASENAEGPTLRPGPLNFQLTDAITLVTEAASTIRSAVVRDLDGDGYPETILTFTAPRPSTTPIPAMIIEASGRMRIATSDFFPTGAPTVKHSPVTLFADINNDGLQDILFAEAGSDDDPWPGSGIGVALNLGGGKYRDVSSLVPADLQATRSYALAVGDIDGDGRAEIVLPDENTGTGNNGSNTALLRWNGNGFATQRSWIASSLWRSPTNLYQHTWMVLNDLDKDGKQDLLVSGTGAFQTTPNLRILFGAAGGYTAAGLVQLPDGLFGHATDPNAPVRQAADVGPVVIADFNNDGLPDIFATEEQVLRYQPGVYTDRNDPAYDFVHANGGTVFADVGFQVLLNQGSRSFTDVTSASSAQNLGRSYYSSLFAVDMNNDGFLDIVGLYQTKFYANRKGSPGTTVFLNDGTGAFQVVDGADLLASVTTTPSNGRTWNLGSFLPTVVTPQRMEGIVIESVGGCGGPGFCVTPRAQIYKVVANRSIGTGPGFVDPATLGVPGFNEFYYLRHYPDAAAAVQAGQYANGLAHYVAVGRGRGYLAHAPVGTASGVPAPPTALVATASGTSVTLTWTAPAGAVLTTYIIEAGSSSGAADLASFSTGTTATTFSATGIRAGTYYVRVRAANAAGSSSPSAEAVLVIGGGSCTAAPDAPSNLTVVSISGGTVVLAWNAASDSASYIVEAGSGPGAANLANSDLGSAATSLTATNVGRGIYYVRIRGKNVCGVGPASNEVIVNVP